MALEVNKFTLARNDIEVVDQYARDQIEEIIHTEVTKAYVDAGDAALQTQIDALPSKNYVDTADSALQTQINNLPNKNYVDEGDAALQIQINGLPSKNYVDTADSALQTQINNLPSKNYVDTADSNLQTQINTKQATITGAASTVTTSNLTASRALGTNGSGKIAVSSVTTTELDYLQGVTSGIQGQLNNKVEKSVFNNQYKTVETDQIDLFMNNISSLKLMYLRDSFKVNMASGWTQLTKNGTNIKLAEKYRPITEQYITQYLPGGQAATIRIKTDGSILIWLTGTYPSNYTVGINLLYI